MKNNVYTISDLQLVCGQKNKKIFELVQELEAATLEISVDELRAKAKKSLDAMKEAIAEGLKSNQKSISGQCGDDCQKLLVHFSEAKPLFGELFEKVATYALATIEENLRMGKIVACPTAGSCAIVPSVLIAISEKLEISEDEQIDALITAGEIGVLVENKVSLAGAVAGCQAECGVASAMAAAALTQIRGGNISQIIHAVALALKNILGLTCDPVAGLVEIPCVKRNVFLAMHAITASELALADVKSKIPPDEVIDALVQTGQLMSPMLKESSQAGLAKTKTAIKIEKKVLDKVSKKTN